MDFKQFNSSQFHLPLANCKNRQLQELVQEKRQQLEKLIHDVNENRNLSNNAKQELAASEQNVSQTNILAKNLRNQSRKESDATRLIRNEMAGLDQQNNKLQRDVDLHTSHWQSQKERLVEERRHLDRLNEMFESEEKVVETMQKMTEAQQDDHDILGKYSHQDSLVIKELEVKLAKSRQAAVETRKSYQSAKTERETTAIQLQNIQEEFRTIMENRNQSLKRWESALHQTEQCQKKRQLYNQELRISKELSNEEADRLKEVDNTIAQVQADVTSLKRTFHSRELLSVQLKSRLEQLEKTYDDNQSELAASEKEMATQNDDTARTEKAISALKSDIDGCRRKLAEENQHQLELQHKLEQITNALGTCAEKNDALHSLSKAVEHRLSMKKRFLVEIENQRVKIEQELNRSTSEWNCCKSEIDLNECRLLQHKKAINERKRQIKRHQEAIYQKNIEHLRVDVELKELRGNIDRLEQRRSLRIEIDGLMQKLDVSGVHLVALKHQLSKTQSEAIGLQRCCDVQQQRTAVLHNFSSVLQCQCLSHEKESDDIKRSVEDIRLRESLICLEIRRRQQLFQTQSDVVENLENERRTIEKVIEHRQQELSNQMELLEVDFRALNERNQQLLAGVQHKQSEIDRIKTRYDLIAVSLTTESGQQDENSEAYFIIKMAQEKEMLKDSIGRLIESVDELKLDNAALTNSLTLVSTSNQQFRQHTIVGVLPDNDEMIKLKMEQQKKDFEQTFRTLKKEANQLELRQNEVEEKIKQLTAEVYAINISMDDHLIRDKEAAEECGNIGRKMERAKNLILLYRKRVHKARKTTAKLMEEVDFEIGQMRETLAATKQFVETLILGDIDAADFFKQCLQGKFEVNNPEGPIPTGSKIDLDIAGFVSGTVIQ